MDNVNEYIQNGVNKVLSLLSEENFIQNMTLTLKGTIATQLREVPCLVFAKLLEENVFDKLTAKQIVTIFSCFTNVTVSEDMKNNLPTSDDAVCQDIILSIRDMYTQYSEKEANYNINSGSNYEIHYDLIHYVSKWCDCESAVECKSLLQKLFLEKGIFLGEFVKALLKINNISSEMEKIAELIGNISLLSKLREIQNMTLKYVVTNQSLYV